MNDNRTLIGRGKIAAIYTDQFFAYKTYSLNYPIDWIAYEVTIQQEVKVKTSLPVLNYTFDKEKREIKMDFIKGITLTDRLRKDKYKDGFKDMQKLQMSIYQYSDLNIPSAYEAYEHQINNCILSDDMKRKAIKALYSVEKKNCLCHLDFHPDNIMFDGNQYYIIDWVNAKLANPVLDLARTYIIFKQYISRQANKYLKEITKSLSIDIDDVYKVLPAIAAIRLLELDPSDFKDTLIDFINNSND